MAVILSINTGTLSYINGTIPIHTKVPCRPNASVVYSVINFVKTQLSDACLTQNIPCE